MNRASYLFRRFWRYLFCRGGHGVHSPFVFDLITRVIEERTPYYAFDTLWHECKTTEGLYRRREAELLFRLVCRYRINNVFILTACVSQTAESYLRAAHKELSIEPYDWRGIPIHSISEGSNHPVLILIESADRIPEFSDLPEGTIIFALTYELRTQKMILSKIRSSIQVSVSVDLPSVWIGVVSGRLNKRQYKAFL